MMFFSMLGSILVCNFLCWSWISYLAFFFCLVGVFGLWECEFFVSSWKFGGDSLSLLLLILSFWILGLMFLGSKKEEVKVGGGNYKFLLLLILFCLFGSFMLVDLLMFYVFFELVLIPMFMFIIMFGYQPERLLSGVFMSMYTVFGSLPLFLGLVWLKGEIGSLNYFYLLVNGLGGVEVWNMLLMVAFMIKLPIFGAHVWLPKAHVEAPVTGSMILAGVLLKLGCYGLVRMMFLLDLKLGERNFFMVLGVWGGLLCGLICMRQLDLKKLIAYSSVTHMGLFLGGLMSWKISGVCGGVIMMVGHGLCSSGLFYSVNILYEQFFSRSIILLKGVMSLYPSLMMWSFFLSLGNMAAPPFLSFFGEVMLGSGSINWSITMGFMLVGMFFITVFYSIYLFSFLSHGGFKGKGGSIIMVVNYMILMLHFLPLGLLLLKMESFFN